MEENSINQIKKRLRAAVDNRVMWSNYYNRATISQAWQTPAETFGNQIIQCETFEQGDFIANAPTDIRFLLKEIERLKKEKK